MIQWLESFGVVPQWGMFATLLTIAGGVITAWIKFGPERKRAANEEKAIDATGMDKLLADYGKQVDQFRREVHALRNELQAVRIELQASDRISQQRNERISTMELIIELLISELERISPEGKKNPIIRQAKLMLRRISGIGDDPNQSHEMNSALAAEADAEQTVAATKRTVADIKANEARASDHGGE